MDTHTPSEVRAHGPAPRLHNSTLMITKHDDLLTPQAQQQIHDFLAQPGWSFGWKSHSKADRYSFWHKHFAGTKDPDHGSIGGSRYTADCTRELEVNAPLLHMFWQHLKATAFKSHTLVRCYANAFSYGCDGTVHTDSESPKSFTSIYYPGKWHANWGGETVFFNSDKTDVIACIYPKPNRFVMFPGTIPHVARGISRLCPALRTTLMFKSEIRDDPG